MACTSYRDEESRWKRGFHARGSGESAFSVFYGVFIRLVYISAFYIGRLHIREISEARRDELKYNTFYSPREKQHYNPLIIRAFGPVNAYYAISRVSQRSKITTYATEVKVHESCSSLHSFHFTIMTEKVITILSLLVREENFIILLITIIEM